MQMSSSPLRPHSPQIDSAEAQDLRRLKERIALLPAHQPFQELEVIATLGMGGFGRVELVSCRPVTMSPDPVTSRPPASYWISSSCVPPIHTADNSVQYYVQYYFIVPNSYELCPVCFNTDVVSTSLFMNVNVDPKIPSEELW